VHPLAHPVPGGLFPDAAHQEDVVVHAQGDQHGEHEERHPPGQGVHAKDQHREQAGDAHRGPVAEQDCQDQVHRADQRPQQGHQHEQDAQQHQRERPQHVAIHRIAQVGGHDRHAGDGGLPIRHDVAQGVHQGGHGVAIGVVPRDDLQAGGGPVSRQVAAQEPIDQALGVQPGPGNRRAQFRRQLLRQVVHALEIRRLRQRGQMALQRRQRRVDLAGERRQRQPGERLAQALHVRVIGQGGNPGLNGVQVFGDSGQQAQGQLHILRRQGVGRQPAFPRPGQQFRRRAELGAEPGDIRQQAAVAAQRRGQAAHVGHAVERQQRPRPAIDLGQGGVRLQTGEDDRQRLDAAAAHVPLQGVEALARFVAGREIGEHVVRGLLPGGIQRQRAEDGGDQQNRLDGML